METDDDKRPVDTHVFAVHEMRTGSLEIAQRQIVELREKVDEFHQAIDKFVETFEDVKDLIKKLNRNTERKAKVIARIIEFKEELRRMRESKKTVDEERNASGIEFNKRLALCSSVSF